MRSAPSGVSVTFSPATIAIGGTSNTVAVDTTAVIATPSFTVYATATGASGQEARFTLAIPPSGIVLTARVSAVTAMQASSVQFPVSITRVAGV